MKRQQQLRLKQSAGSLEMNIADVRRFALSLPEVTEEPHFDLASFRVKGKIFATVPTEEKHLHVFVEGAVLDVLPAARGRARRRLSV